jgi:hypothetical protein
VPETLILVAEELGRARDEHIDRVVGDAAQLRQTAKGIDTELVVIAAPPSSSRRRSASDVGAAPARPPRDPDR